ncbi:MAG: hypothetical protein BGO69_18930 [Bacteroidetes bacterium 46-16]|nr:MAG: hypothetical protein BGO69_18930 [Bacteroidetes bacterium 46-16]
MDTQSQNMQEQQENAANNEQNRDEQQANTGKQGGKEKKKYHKSALYASTLLRDSVGHVKPHNHSGLDL